LSLVVVKGKGYGAIIFGKWLLSYGPVYAPADASETPISWLALFGLSVRRQSQDFISDKRAQSVAYEFKLAN
jgi:hypothetical protein